MRNQLLDWNKSFYVNLSSSFLASISPLKRNIFTYLDKLFIRVASMRVVILVRHSCKEFRLIVASLRSRGVSVPG